MKTMQDRPKPVFAGGAADSYTATMIRIHAFLPLVQDTLGPGNRAVVWVQGCSLRCTGCMVPETWDAAGGYQVNPLELAQQIAALPDIEGITISGGEAFQQASAVAALLEPLKASGLNSWLYTGYRIEELVAMNSPEVDRLLSLTDVLVDGRFEETGDIRRFCGSPNQRIICLTDAIPAERINAGSKARLEMTLDGNGKLVLVGIPPRGFMQAFREKMQQRGVSVVGERF
jgi:anaerobic ribonucleoside-triphosphate reductase activating protein